MDREVEEVRVPEGKDRDPALPFPGTPARVVEDLRQMVESIAFKP